MAEPTTAKRAEKAPDPALTERLRLEVERALQRSLKAVELLGAPPPTVGRTPKTVLRRRGTMELVHYHATADEIYRVPILFVMAPTNKAYILDLAPGQSLIEFLLGRGYDVYLIDWNAPTDDERDLKLDNYVLDFIPDCIRRVQQDSGEQDVTLIGYCAGGMLSSIYQALHPGRPGQEPGLLHDAGRLLEDGGVPLAVGLAPFRRRQVRRQRRHRAGRLRRRRLRLAAPGEPRSPARCGSGTTSGTTSSSRATG